MQSGKFVQQNVYDDTSLCNKNARNAFVKFSFFIRLPEVHNV